MSLVPAKGCVVSHLLGKGGLGGGMPVSSVKRVASIDGVYLKTISKQRREKKYISDFYFFFIYF